MSQFSGATLLITGGTGSFGNTVLKHFLTTDIGEIRIFSRDEKKQDDMRHGLQARFPENARKVKFYIGDVRSIQSLRDAMSGVDYIFHAAALKQVPSCEFFPMEAVRTNVIGTDNLLHAAIEAGVKPGDVVLAVNGEPVGAKDARQMDQAIQMIRDVSGDTLELTLRRGQKVQTLSLKPRSITMQRVTHQVLPGNIGYIMIYEFIGDDATGFISAMNDLKQQNVKGLIIDIRSNPGGLLTDVVKIADQLLTAGLVVYTQDRSGAREEYYSEESRWDVPMAVLVNGMSASASEILAGALQDYGVAKIVGVKTFGKGIVQTMLPFRTDGAGMQLTTATYYTPKGRMIHGTGITPDVPVEATVQVGGEPDLEKDAQLKAAYDLLTK
jgi:C-terminal peptidase prc